MSQQADALRVKMQALLKGAVALEQDREREIRLLKGVVATGHDLLVELRAEELVAKGHVNR